MAWPAREDDSDDFVSTFPEPPPGGAVSNSAEKDAGQTAAAFDAPRGDKGSSIFESLLAQLNSEHERQLEKLQSEISRLSAIAASASAGQTLPPGSPTSARPTSATSAGSLPHTPSQAFSEHLRHRNTLSPVFAQKGESERPPSETSKRIADKHLLSILHPDQTSRFERFMSGPMDVISGACILLSIGLMFVRSEYDGYAVGVELGYQDPDSWNWPDGLSRYLHILQYFFTVVFAVEMLLRLCMYRSLFFHTGTQWQFFNIIDLIVVLVMLIDQFIFVAMRTAMDNTAFFRLCRVVKVLRALRALRAVKIFHHLRALVLTVIASLYALFWSMVLLAILMLMAALGLCQWLSDRLKDEDISEATREWVYMMYGTAGRSYYTVFELTFSGGWPNYARTLVEEVDSAFSYFFIVYISLVVFATFRIITAIFLKDTLAAAANDTEMVIAEKTKEKENYARKLRNFFEAADTTGDGLITLEEFQACLSDPRIKMYLHHLELDTREYEQLFAMMDDGDGYVSVDEFTEGALRVKGVARAQDLLAIAHNVRKLSDTVRTCVERLHIELRALSRDVGELRTTSI